MTKTSPSGILETVLYAVDLVRARNFYEGVLGLECFAEEPGRHVFFRCGGQVMLIFNPEETALKRNTGLPVPVHGAYGQGHICFRASGPELDAWRLHLEKLGVPIEADFEWPGGGRSLYFRDPANNSVELAEPRIWGLK